MAITDFNIRLKFSDVERVVNALRKQRDADAHALHATADEYLTDRKYNSETKEYEDVESHVVSWRLTTAENFVKDYDGLDEVVSWFTGERTPLDPERLVLLRAARERYDAEVAARRAAAEQESQDA